MPPQGKAERSPRLALLLRAIPADSAGAPGLDEHLVQEAHGRNGRHHLQVAADCAPAGTHTSGQAAASYQLHPRTGVVASGIPAA